MFQSRPVMSETVQNLRLEDVIFLNNYRLLLLSTYLWLSQQLRIPTARSSAGILDCGAAPPLTHLVQHESTLPTYDIRMTPSSATQNGEDEFLNQLEDRVVSIMVLLGAR